MQNIDLKTLGERLRRARKHAGLSKGQAAILLGMRDKHIIAAIEGGTFDPSEERLAQLAELYGVAVSDFFAPPLVFADEQTAVQALKEGQISVPEFLRWSTFDWVQAQEVG